MTRGRFAAATHAVKLRGTLQRRPDRAGHGGKAARARRDVQGLHASAARV